MSTEGLGRGGVGGVVGVCLAALQATTRGQSFQHFGCTSSRDAPDALAGDKSEPAKVSRSLEVTAPREAHAHTHTHRISRRSWELVEAHRRYRGAVVSRSCSSRRYARTHARTTHVHEEDGALSCARAHPPIHSSPCTKTSRLLKDVYKSESLSLPPPRPGELRQHGTGC